MKQPCELTTYIRTNVIIPLLHIAVGITAFLSAMVAADRLYHFYVAVYWRFFSKVKPESIYSHEPLPDMATFPHLYPRVVVQLPMFNEREVCRQVSPRLCCADSRHSRSLRRFPCR
jgi:beta-mannan synthase